MQFEDYIMTTPAEVQGRLIDILQIFQKAFPAAEQRIYHGIPTFFCGKQDIINIGAYKNHFGLHVGYDMVDYLKYKYPDRIYTKSTVSIPYNKPLPYELIDDICQQLQNRLT